MTRVLAVAVGVIVVLGGLVALISVFSARDDAGVERGGGPGALEPDRGAQHVARAPERTGGDPPTSGPHAPQLVTRDGAAVPDDALLHALELGDVVLTYPGARPPPELRTLQKAVAGAFDAELAAAGQAVVLARVPGSGGVQALAWRRRLRAPGAGDPALRSFAEYWLGRGLEGG